MRNRAGVLSIIIPTLNEEQGIKRTLNEIPIGQLNSLGYDVEIIVVDGLSTDATHQVAQEYGAKVVMESRKGYGRAYKTAFSHAVGDIMVTLDADGTYPAYLIPEYVKALQTRELDFITINRFSKLSPGSMSLLHLFGNKILSSTLRLLYRVSISDSQSGMWIFRRQFIERINLASDDMSLSEEIKIIAFKFFRSHEVVGEYKIRVGEAKLDSIGHGWSNFKYLFQYWRKMKSAVRKPAATEDVPLLQEISKD